MAQSRSKPQSVDSELNPFAFRAFGTGSNIADTLIQGGSAINGLLKSVKDASLKVWV